MSPTMEFILVASFGSICQEVFHLFELRKNLTDNVFFKSPAYWIITLLMVVVSGVGTWLIFYDQIPNEKGIQVILGAAFPLIFKKGVSSFGERHLGTTSSQVRAWEQYFLL